jgi:hypothetical protein
MLNPEKLHPAIKGYQVWADALKPILAELLGPAANTRRRRQAIQTRDVSVAGASTVAKPRLPDP